MTRLAELIFKEQVTESSHPDGPTCYSNGDGVSVNLLGNEHMLTTLSYEIISEN